MFRWFMILVVGLALCALPAQAQWVVKNGWIDYCNHKLPGDTITQYTYDGMPDFCQKQDAWRDSTANPPKWNWCGVVATANCLWWYDSKFEMIKCKLVPPGPQVRPPTVKDNYPLVYSIAGAAWDDHRPANVIPWITALGGAFGPIPPGGMTGNQLKIMIQNWLAMPAVNLWGHYVVTIKSRPTLDEIWAQVDSSQNQMALLGFWQMHAGGEWVRFGGHWLTVAGADKTPGAQQISFSDNCVDNAEPPPGMPGAIWDGWIMNHVHGLHAAGVHNDAGNVSHDYYSVGASGSPGGIISPNGYGDYWPDSTWENFEGLNPNDTLTGVTGDYVPGLPVHTELEEILMVCPNFDYGDLGEDYPTIDVESCGPAHPLTDKAWLGPLVTAEVKPRILNLDNSDDGVTFLHLPWNVAQSCTVNVTVTMGAHYGGEALYLTAWIDGNSDGDFDDGPATFEDDSLNCSEWVIQDFVVAAGANQFVFCKPGVGTGIRPTIMRFRLNSLAAGRFGYGGYWGGGVSNGWGTYDIDWVLGEVEDYSFPILIPHPIDDLVIAVVSYLDPIILAWTCPEEGTYFIYSTTNKNNHGDPRHESGWTPELLPMYFPPGPATATVPMSTTDTYKNYVIVYDTP
ncbi:MAG: GEVED domain-containing protein [bacterium]|nr:GEVED domain-containing protein [bacterium]